MYSLTTPQHNIWNLQKYYEGTSISNICGAVFYNRNMDNAVLEKAINKVIEVYGGLRLQFREANGKAVQYTSEYEFRNIPAYSFDNMQSFDNFAQKQALEPMELIDSPMYRFIIFNLDDKTGVLLCANHLISDAWTFSLLAREVEAQYDNLTDSEEIRYEEYIEAEQKYFESARYEKDKLYWSEKYSDKPEPCPIKMITVPVSVPTAARHTHIISAEKTAEINRFCDENSVSQAVLFEAAVMLYLSRINNENRTVTLGIPVLNRTNVREKSTVGMFISTTPLTVAVFQEDTVALLCDKITAAHKELFRHQKFPYSHILQSIRENHDFTGNLYDVMVSFQNAKTDTSASTKWYSNGYSEVPFSLHIDNRDSADSYTMTIDYQTEVFRQSGEINLLAERILHIINQIMENNSKAVSEISIIPDAEYDLMINKFNDTAMEYPRDKCVHELFMEQASKTPDKIALVFEDKQFTYKQLDEMSNSLAHYLHEKGVKPNDVVPIIAKRSWHIIVAMLGILKAGGAYMPVDPTYPIDRIEYMFETANVKTAVTYEYDKVLDVDVLDLAHFDYNNNNRYIDIVNSPEDLCYIIFTSGSTGKPKGVSVCHRNVSNYCNKNCYNKVCHKIIENFYDSIVSTTNIIFDIFVTESILPLLNGITIYFANDEEVSLQKKLSDLILNSTIDVMQTTPTKMRSYILDKSNTVYLNTLKVIVLGGEALPTDLFLELRQCTDAEIFNIYGPAETTVWSTNKNVDNIDITIGKPIANTQIYILDQNKKPLPIGVAGELCISGDGVGKGYLNRPELTAEKFIPNPFIEGKTMYLTGDLARWRDDGEIEYLGRIDTQVKIRGLRIELGEIESVMSSFEGIHMTAVTDKRDENNRQYLVGYYTADTNIDEKALRQHLSAKLPKYMVPNYFVHLDEMPMTASGKTDRKNLPLPDFTVSQEEYIAPETEREKQLCGVLCELFAMEQIGVTDDFFDIGGDSLKAIEYVAKAHTAGVEFALQNVFDYPTVRELCNFLENGAEKAVRYTATGFEKYEEILSRNVIDENYIPEKKSLGNILVTGATGFLGAHILDNLLQSEKGKIYCLVRSNSPNDRRGRWPQLLKYYFGDKYDSEIGRRIIPIVGDIVKENLSNSIPDDVQTVIHTAATVKHYGSYEYFRNVNVEGTRNVVNYAKRVDAKLIHISTLSVSGNSLADEFSVYRSEEEKNFYEYSLFIGQPLENVYVRSKFEAELEVLDAMLDGLDAKIVRVGNLTNRLSDSKFQPNYESNAFLTRFKAAVELGMFPDYLLPLYVEFSPIDQTAEGVVKIAQYADKQCVFHLNSNRPIYFNRLLEVFRQLDIKMELVTGEMFNNVLQKIAEDSKTEYIYEAFQNDMDENGQLVYDSNIRLKNDFTDWFMRKLDFEWAQIDFEYIKDYVEYFRGIGYLEV